MKSDMSLMEQGLDENSAAKVCSAAHSIKGAAASLGVGGIYDTSFEIEKDSRGGGLEAAKVNIPVLKELLLELQEL